MKFYINLQSENDLKEGYVSDGGEFFQWFCENKPKGKCLFVVMPKEETKEVFITSSVDAVYNYFEHLFFDDKLFIQVFAAEDYKDALGYLLDLFEVSEPNNEIPPLSIN